MSEHQQERRLRPRGVFRGSPRHCRQVARIAIPDVSMPYSVNQSPLRERGRLIKKVRVAIPTQHSSRLSLKSSPVLPLIESKARKLQKLHKVNMSLQSFKTNAPNQFQAFYVRNPGSPSYFHAKAEASLSAKDLEVSLAVAKIDCKDPPKKEFRYKGYIQRGRSFGSPPKSFRTVRYREYLL